MTRGRYSTDREFDNNYSIKLQKYFNNEAEEIGDDRFVAAMAILSDKEKSVLKAYYLDGYNMSDGAKAIGVTTQNFSKVMRIARRKLKKACGTYTA